MGKSATAVERKGKGPSELGEVNREIKAENERRVIDLAAERAMREARAAAKGRVDDVRPEKSFSRTEPRSPQHYAALRASRQPEPPPKVPPKFAREAVQRREATAAPIRTRTIGNAHHGGARAPQREFGKAGRATEKAAGKSVGILARGVLGLLAGLVKWLDLFPAKPPTPEQQERNHRAAEQQQAADERKAEKDVALRQILERISRDDQERERQRRERGGRDDDRGRERDRGYER